MAEITIKHKVLLSELQDMSFDQIHSANEQLYVPDEQRKYEWTTKEIEELIDDIQQTVEATTPEKKVHFMNMVTIGKRDNKKWLVDGQQRLTTLCLIIAVVRDLVSRITRELSNAGVSYEEKYDYLPGKAQTLLAAQPEEAGSFLVLKKYNKDFHDVLKKRPTAEDLATKTKIMETYTNISNKLNRLIGQIKNDDGSYSIEPLKKLADFFDAIRNNLIFVSCVLSDKANINRIFTTTNSRGLNLKPADKLKNLFMEQYGNQQDKETFSAEWSAIDAYFEDSALMTKFVTAYWDARCEYTSEGNLLSTIKRNIKGKGGNYVNEIVKELKNSVPLYKSISSAGLAIEIERKDAKLITAIKTSTGIPMKTHFPVIIAAVIKNYTDNNIANLIEDLNVFNTREILAKTKSNTRKSFFDSLAQNIYKENWDYETVHNELVKKQKERTPAEVFNANAKSYHYKANSDAFPKYVLSKIYKSETDVDYMPDANIEVEHIYPKNPNRKVWYGHDINDSENKFLLGNLTLLDSALNKTALNRNFTFKLCVYSASGIPQTKKIFEAKKEESQEFSDWYDSLLFDKDGNPITIKSYFATDKTSKNLDKQAAKEDKNRYIKWGEAEILERNNRLLSIAEQVISLNEI